MVLNHDDADDVLQNTFIKVFGNLKNFKGDSLDVPKIGTSTHEDVMQQRAKNKEYQTKNPNKK